MAQLRFRAVGLPLALLLGVSSLVCSGSHPALQAPAHDSPAALFARTAPTSSGALAFPPAESTRVPRSPLTDTYSIEDRTATLAVNEPSLDSRKSFSFTGTALQVVFNQPVNRGEIAAAGKGKGKKKEAPLLAARGTLKITPEVRAPRCGSTSARWSSRRRSPSTRK